MSVFNGGPLNGPASLNDPFAAARVPPSFELSGICSSQFEWNAVRARTNPNLKDGKTYEYNLNVQYAAGRGYLLQVGYVGTQSVNRPGQIQF